MIISANVVLYDCFLRPFCRHLRLPALSSKTKKVIRDARPTRALHQAFLNGDAENVAAGLTAIMDKKTHAPEAKAQGCTEGEILSQLLLGLPGNEPNWLILSNAESDEGLSGIL